MPTSIGSKKSACIFLADDGRIGAFMAITPELIKYYEVELR
jgi:hypothetical protein